MPNLTEIIDKKIVRNRLETQFHIHSERTNRDVDEIKAEFQSLFFPEGGYGFTWWINNSSQPSLVQAIKIAKYFERKVEEIFFLE